MSCADADNAWTSILNKHNASYVIDWKESERCAKWNRNIDDQVKIKHLKVKDKSLGRSQIDDGGKLKIDDLTTNYDKQRKSNASRRRPKPCLPSSTNHKSNSYLTTKKSISQLQLGYDQAIRDLDAKNTEINKLKSRIDLIENENKELKLKYSDMICTNAMLVESVRKGTTLCTNSSTNFFEFIEVFKNLQNIVMGNEKRYVSIFKKLCCL